VKTIHLYHVEGIDGAGKTTFCKKLLDLLKRERTLAGETVADKVTKFPTAYPEKKFSSSEAIHGSIFYMQDFSNVVSRILDDEEACDHYVLDRSFISTSVYQGFDNDSWGFYQDYPTDAIYRFNNLGKSILDFCIRLFTSTKEGVTFQHHIFHIDVCPKIAYERLRGRISETKVVSDYIDELILSNINTGSLEDKNKAIKELEILDSKYGEVIRKIRMFNYEIRGGNIFTITKINVNGFTLDTNLSEVPSLACLKYNPYIKR